MKKSDLHKIVNEEIKKILQEIDFDSGEDTETYHNRKTFKKQDVSHYAVSIRNNLLNDLHKSFEVILDLFSCNDPENRNNKPQRLKFLDSRKDDENPGLFLLSKENTQKLLKGVSSRVDLDEFKKEMTDKVLGIVRKLTDSTGMFTRDTFTKYNLILDAEKGMYATFITKPIPPCDFFIRFTKVKTYKNRSEKNLRQMRKWGEAGETNIRKNVQKHYILQRIDEDIKDINNYLNTIMSKKPNNELEKANRSKLGRRAAELERKGARAAAQMRNAGEDKTGKTGQKAETDGPSGGQDDPQGTPDGTAEGYFDTPQENEKFAKAKKTLTQKNLTKYKKNMMTKSVPYAKSFPSSFKELRELLRVLGDVWGVRGTLEESMSNLSAIQKYILREQPEDENVPPPSDLPEPDPTELTEKMFEVIVGLQKELFPGTPGDQDGVYGPGTHKKAIAQLADTKGYEEVKISSSLEQILAIHKEAQAPTANPETPPVQAKSADTATPGVPGLEDMIKIIKSDEFITRPKDARLKIKALRGKNIHLPVVKIFKDGKHFLHGKKNAEKTNLLSKFIKDYIKAASAAHIAHTDSTAVDNAFVPSEKQLTGLTDLKTFIRGTLETITEESETMDAAMTTLKNMKVGPSKIEDNTELFNLAGAATAAAMTDKLPSSEKKPPQLPAAQTALIDAVQTTYMNWLKDSKK